MRMMVSALLVLAACGGDAPTGGTATAGGGDGASADSGGEGGTDASACVTDEEHYAASVAPLLQSDCATCHAAGGLAAGTRYLLQVGSDEATRAANRAMLADFVTGTDDGATLLLDKPTGGTSHGGGVRFDLLDPRYAALHELVARLQDPGQCAHPGEPPVTCDGTIRPGPTPLRRLTDVQVDNTVVDVFDVALPAALFPATTRNADFRTFATNNLVSAAGTESILLTGEAVSGALELEEALDCGAPAEDCARSQLLDWAAQLYRRPLTSGETALVTSFLDAGVGAEDGVRMGVELLLQSPQFLYLDAPAAVPQSDDQTALLSDWAIAARLAYFLTDRPPDATLRAAAAAGEVHTRAQVRAHAERLVASPLAAPVVARFHRDWLDLYRFDSHFKDEEAYPLWSDDLVDAMKIEADLFTTEVVWLGSGRLDELLTSPVTWVNQDLAALYGLDDPGPGWHRVTLDPSTRPGILTRSAFLASHAYAASSSPVSRGAFVLQAMLCEELNPPQDVNMDLPEESEDAPTIRERLAQHTSDPACVACHERIDPIGFSFEHYDAIGAWRDAWESGIPVDASGTLDGVEIDGAGELLDLLQASDGALEVCYAQRWFEYGVGRPASDQDACSVRDLGDRFVASGGDLRTLLVDVAMTDAFLFRELP